MSRAVTIRCVHGPMDGEELVVHLRTSEVLNLVSINTAAGRLAIYRNPEPEASLGPVPPGHAFEVVFLEYRLEGRNGTGH